MAEYAIKFNVLNGWSDNEKDAQIPVESTIVKLSDE